MSLVFRANSRRSGLFKLAGRLAFVAALSLMHAQVFAQDENSKAARIEAERKAAFEAANKVSKPGPDSIRLTDQANLALPKGYVFVPQPEAGQIMRANGSTPGSHLLGLLFPSGTGRHWWAKIEFINSGYVKDDEAKNWDADGLLKNLQEGTEAGNEDRVERGFAPIEVTGWVEPPAYDAVTHRLVWSAKVRDKGDENDVGSINYNTYALGRDGYFSLDLIGDPDAIAGDKTYAKELLGDIAFIDGKKYSDFNASTDHVAEFGIAALVGGVAAKKLGLLAVIGVFLLKAWKLTLIGLVAFGAAARKFISVFTRKKPAEPQA
jgi:uncharacterized membrane-anchored protein